MKAIDDITSSLPKNKADLKSMVIRWLSVFALVELLIIAGCIYALAKAPEDFEVWSVPDLTQGGTVKLNEAPPWHVYAFAFNTLQNLMYCEKDCSKEELEQVYALGYYLTPNYRAALVQQAQLPQRKRDNVNLIRWISTAQTEGVEVGYTSERVHVVTPGKWIVFLDVQVRTFIGSQLISDEIWRHSFYVVRGDVNRENNPWRLQLDGYYKEPERVK